MSRIRRPRGIYRIDFYRFRIFSKSGLSVGPEADRNVLTDEQGLGKLCHNANDADQGDRAPEVQPRRFQMVRRPDNVEGLKESTPVEFACG